MILRNVLSLFLSGKTVYHHDSLFKMILCITLKSHINEWKYEINRREKGDLYSSKPFILPTALTRTVGGDNLVELLGLFTGFQESRSQHTGS